MRMPTRSAMPSARSRSWETTIEVTWYCSRRVAMTSEIVADITGSSSLVGSS